MTFLEAYIEDCQVFEDKLDNDSIKYRDIYEITEHERRRGIELGKVFLAESMLQTIKDSIGEEKLLELFKQLN